VGTQQQKKGRGGRRGAGLGARGGTEDDDQGLGLSDDFFFKSGRRLSSVPTSNLYEQQQLLLNSRFHFTRIPRPASKFSTHKQMQFQANNSSSQVCTSIYLSINLSATVVVVVVVCCFVVVVHELLQLLLLLLQETELSSLNIVRQSFTDLSARLYIITELRISQKAVDSFLK
jgi:hypothetical protein